MQVDQVLKKNFWIVILPLIAIVALLNAQAVTQLVGISLGPDEKALAAPPPAARGGAAGSASARNLSAEPILSRNPFDHVTGSLKPAPISTNDDDSMASAGPLDTSDPWNAPKCDGVKVLIIVASADPEWSFAAFGGDKTIMRRRGGEVNGKQVHFVGWDRVWLQNGSSLCQATLFDKTEVKTEAKPAPVASSSAPSSGRGLDPSMAKGIQKISATEYNIDRGVVDKILENQAELMRQARIVPEQENGRVVGIRLFGVKPDSLLAAIGLENSDRLQTINGFDVASPEKALEAYARLRTADKLTISLNRKGQNMNIDYNIK